MHLMAVIPLRPEMEDIISFSMSGFLLVMIVLALLSTMVSIIGQAFIFADKAKAAKAKAKAAPAEAAPKGVSDDHARVIAAAVASVMPELENDSAKLVAVLSAAAAVALDEECRVVNYKPISGEFSKFGREQIFASHNYTPSKFNNK